MIKYLLIVLVISSTVAGQIFIKLASSKLKKFNIRSIITNQYVYFSFLCIAFTPFVTNLAMDEFDLSILFAFTGLNYVFTTLASHFILKEELNVKMIIGIVCISFGIFLYHI